MQTDAPSHQVEIWRFSLSLSDALRHYYRQQLPTNEQAQLESINHPKLQQQWLCSRGILRCALAAKFNQPAQSFTIIVNEFGKPMLDDTAGQFCEFNLSHSNAYGVLALCETAPVGIDLQFMRQSINPIEFSQRFFSPHETQCLQACASATEQMALFYRLWTGKEALLKALGKGIVLEDLKTNIIPDNQLDSRATVSINGQICSLNTLPAWSNYQWSVCALADSLTPRWHDWHHPSI